jgi:hypothetical protein
MKGKQKVPTSIQIKNVLTYNSASADLRKKAVKKFEWWALRNEIDVITIRQKI